MEFLLIGQPNSGKSTIFNYVVGYKSVASNFPGVTVQFTKGELEIFEKKINVTDLPGTYSLQTTDEAESVAVKYLLKQVESQKLPATADLEKVESESKVFVNIVDASVLSRSLELTLQLLEMNKPVVVALNMIDEAGKKGMKVDIKRLSEILGCPVITTIGKKGIGVYELFELAYKTNQNKSFKSKQAKIKYTSIVEKTISLIVTLLNEKEIPEKWNYRFIAIKILEKDRIIKEFLKEYIDKSDYSKIEEYVEVMEKILDEKSPYVISSARHSTALNIFEDCVKVGKPKKKDFREKIDDILMHPILGYVSLVTILFISFWTVFKIGNFLEPVFLDTATNITAYFEKSTGKDSILYYLISGLVTGLGGGIGIIIPYLLPFFIVLSFLEDTGYLARIAYLTDNIMHKIGLHGLSIVPVIFGYGCTVPAILATRILKSPRDKLITATLTTIIPCSARMTVIFGLVGFFISIKAAILIYILNIIIVAILGKFMAKAFPEVSPGLILEIPKYHLPGIKSLFNKTWFRLKEFVTVALPLLIVGSVVLEVIEYFKLDGPINSFLSPFTTGVLGLPSVIGITLIFGIMRKELALLLLFSALGTQNVSDVMSIGQILTFTTFVTFYLPCLATFAALSKELKFNKSMIITLSTIVLATGLAVIVRLIATIV